MKKSPIKTPKKTKNLEEKVDFLINFMQTEVVTKNYLHGFTADFARKSDIIKIQNQIDGLAKQIKDYHQEMVMFVHKVERMEAWIKKVSQKIGIPYEF